jgi:hypothetical protein
VVVVTITFMFNQLIKIMKETIHLKLSKEDKEFIQSQADKHRMTKSGYLRYLAITKQKE